MAAAQRKAELTLKRDTIKTAMQRIQAWADNPSPSTRDIFDVDANMELYEHYRFQLDDVQNELETIDSKETEQRGEIDKTLIELRSKLKRLRFSMSYENYPTPDGSPNSSANGSPQVQVVHTVPTLPFPKLKKFNGVDYLEYPNFINTFKAIANSNEAKNCSKIQLFTLLRESLEGRAYDTIRHIEVNEENLDVALVALEERFSKKRLIFESHIRKLMDTPKANSGTQLRSTLDHVQTAMKALETLPATPEEIGLGVLSHFILNKVDTTTLTKWEEEITNTSDRIPTWKELFDFLNKRANQFESIAFIHSHDNIKMKNQRTTYLLTKANCGFCNDAQAAPHDLNDCQLYQKISPKERYEWVKENNYCLRCLTALPHTEPCNMNRCSKCRNLHHVSVHFNDYRTTKRVNSKSDTSSPAKTYNVCNGAGNTKLQILATAVVLLQGANNEFIPARVLIDTGSMSNFVTQRLASKLNTRFIKTSAPVMALFGDMKIKQAVILNVKSTVNEFRETIECLVLPKFEHFHPIQNVNVDSIKIPKNIKLADPNFYKAQGIDGIFGVELAFKILMMGQIKLTDELLLQKSSFGWLVAGAIDITKCNNNKTLTFTASTSAPPIEEVMQRFWEIECIPINKKSYSPQEQFCEEHFQRNTTRDESGRFIVRLPFVKSPSLLGYSYPMAVKRLSATERKLTTNKDLEQMYNEFLKVYEEMGHMEEVSTENINQYNILPHHGVFRPDSSSTKLRVVFDASAPTSSGVSLNDLLAPGPTVQPLLFLILLQFRLHKIALCGDIPKMFRQFLVHKDDRKYQCILVRRNGRIILHQLNTVTYGTTSAPFLSTRCVVELANTESGFPLASKALLEDTYVDNTLTGADTEEEVIELYHQIIGLLSKAGMSMKKWCSNSAKALEIIPEEDRETLLTIADDEVAKALGLYWSPQSDLLMFSVEQPAENEKWSKRKILSYIGKHFDPHGFIGPVVSRLKILAQNLWSRSLHWDESLPQDIATTWSKYVREQSALSEIKIPRFILVSERPTTDIQVHCFADASKLAYGVVIYLRITYSDGTVLVRILCSKSRVAPLKTVTLPRLELCGAVVLSELLTLIRPTIQHKISAIYCWLDAQVALTWIKNSPHRYGDFVATRVTKVQELTGDCTWRHVPGKLNPADILSRGTSPKTLVNENQWFEGPDFLKLPEDQWLFPVPEDIPDDDERLEAKGETLCFYSKVDVDLVASYKYVGSIMRIQKTFGYIARFYNRLSKKEAPPSNEQLSALELEHGLLLAVRIVQAQNLYEDYQALKADGVVPVRSHIRQLAPFIDGDGVIRVGGRLGSAPDLSFNERHPILLPKSHQLTKTVFFQYHWDNLHAGPQALLAAIRRKFWPVGGRVLARQTYRSCIVCSQYSRRTFTQIMADLPQGRVEPFENAFEIAGLDLFGPFTVKQFGRGSPRITIYAMAFVCFRTKAVMYQAVFGETTNDVMNALIRLLNRTVCTKQLWADNATNNRGASRILTEVDWNQVDEWCRNKKRIDWKFIPARSPHHGGLWEAAVKSAKTHLVKVLKDKVLNIDAFITLLSMVEVVLNNRPITPIAINPQDGQPLTPAHFFKGGPVATLPDPLPNELPTERRDLVKTWLQLCEIKRHWLDRWQIEYRQQLQQRVKWTSASPNVKLNKVVMMVDKDRAPHAWMVARITKLFPGRDGRVRSVEVTAIPRSASGSPRVFTRAITELVPLPQEDEESEAV